LRNRKKILVRPYSREKITLLVAAVP